VLGIPEWAVGVGFIILAVAVGQIVVGRFLPAGRLRGRKALDAVQPPLGDLEDVQRRLADVEERLDFAERMLAKQRDGERIAPPKL